MPAPKDEQQRLGLRSRSECGRSRSRRGAKLSACGAGALATAPVVLLGVSCHRGRPDFSWPGRRDRRSLAPRGKRPRPEPWTASSTVSVVLSERSRAVRRKRDIVSARGKRDVPCSKTSARDLRANTQIRHLEEEAESALNEAYKRLKRELSEPEVAAEAMHSTATAAALKTTLQLLSHMSRQYLHDVKHGSQCRIKNIAVLAGWLAMRAADFAENG